MDLPTIHTTYIVLLATQFVLSAFVFVMLFKFVAPYGRYVNSAPRGAHFISYRTGWLIMEVPAVLTIAVLYGARVLFFDEPLPPLLTVFFLMWEFHYVYRALIFPFLIKNKPREFFVPVVLGGAVFNILNGFINGWALFFHYDALPKAPLALVGIGIVVFFAGFFIHVVSDKLLRDVKRENNGAYGIPKAFLHAYVSSPNYFGEILQWIGFFIATLSPAALSFALFTFANLMPRARAHRRWYRQTFPQYPRNRKILIPFIL